MSARIFYFFRLLGRRKLKLPIDKFAPLWYNTLVNEGWRLGG